jgi:hypothetical protein
VARLDQILRLGVRVDRDLDRPGPVGGGDPRGHALARLDGDGEGGLERCLVLGRHQVEAELLAALVGQCETDQAPAVGRHEVDGFGGRELRGEREIALVLAVLVIADDHHPPAADVLDRLLDGGEGRLLRGLGQIAFSHSFLLSG